MRVGELGRLQSLHPLKKARFPKPRVFAKELRRFCNGPGDTREHAVGSFYQLSGVIALQVALAEDL
jgi:hypothetical protein